jgi:hypothetical protein
MKFNFEDLKSEDLTIIVGKPRQIGMSLWLTSQYLYDYQKIILEKFKKEEILKIRKKKLERLFK